MESDANRIYYARLTRRLTFSAAHRLHSCKLTDEENKKLYGKCNHSNGHGHNYVVKISVHGPVDPVNGMVMNMTDLKHNMQLAITDKLDHKNLDADVEYFREHPSTTEHVAMFIWNSMKSVMSNPKLLQEVKVYETENNIVSFTGQYN